MRAKKILLGLLIVVLTVSCTLIPAASGPTPTSGPPPTLSPSATPSPTLTPTPSPTPVPTVRIETADEALFNGDYVRARSEYQNALNDSQDPNVRAAALWGLSRTEFEAEDYAAALTWLRSLITTNPDSTLLAHDYFLTGEAYMALDRYSDAAASFMAYLTLRPGILDSYVQEKRGDALYAAGDYVGALGAYQSASEAPREGDGIDLEIKLARTRAAMGDFANALSLYDDIATKTTNNYTLATLDYLAGSAYQSLGQTDQANARFVHTIQNYPLAFDSYQSLIILLDNGYPVSDLNRGLVDYFAGQYGVALAALERYIDSGQDDGTAHYYRALTLRALGRYEDAVNEFTYFIENYPNHQHWVDAWDDKSYTQWAYLDRIETATQTLLDFVSAVPNASQAPNFLMSAGRMYERANMLEKAAQTWERVANEYPSNQQGTLALFWAALSRYRLGNYQLALTGFQRSLLLASEPEDRARALLWIGKIQQILGDTAANRDAWQQAQSLDPTGYYSERARDLLMGHAPFTPPPTYQSQVDLIGERAEAAAWVRITFNLPADTDLTNPGTLLQDARLQRGVELWQLGLYEEAQIEFEDLRQAVSSNPADSFRLGNYLLDLGLYRTAIFTIRQVLTLAGLQNQVDSLRAPAYFSHVRYGMYYQQLIEDAASSNGMHPLFLFSVVRQESLFEGFVRSTAGARGLMQIIPSTGESIAKNMGWPPDFTPDDLYRPQVSIDLGAHYMASNRDYLYGDLYAALAAYNAGPGNASIWQSLAGNDPDLFIEIVRFDETRQYIRNIYEIFTIYRSLYSPNFQ
jgi:soluble lytic murein transglycosylase